MIDEMVGRSCKGPGADLRLTSFAYRRRSSAVSSLIARASICVAVILVTVACTAENTSPTNEAGTSASATSTLDAEAGEQLIELQDQLRLARQTLEMQYYADPELSGGCFEPPFLVIAPADLAGYDVGPLKIGGMNASGRSGVGSMQDFGLGPMGASIIVRFFDRGDQARWVSFRQESACNGVVPEPPQDVTDISRFVPIDVPSLNPQKSLPRLTTWTEADGDAYVQLDWCSDCFASPGTGYQLAGHNVDQDTLVSMAASMQPVCCGADPPATTVARSLSAVAEPVPATWSTGTATVTINEAKWTEDSTGFSEFGTWLMIDVSYLGASGEVPFQPMLDWTARAVNGAGINAMEFSDDPAFNPDQVVTVEPGQELRRWLYFGLPREPTTVKLSQGGRRVATWSIAG